LQNGTKVALNTMTPING